MEVVWMSNREMFGRFQCRYAPQFTSLYRRFQIWWGRVVSNMQRWEFPELLVTGGTHNLSLISFKKEIHLNMEIHFATLPLEFMLIPQSMWRMPKPLVTAFWKGWLDKSYPNTHSREKNKLSPWPRKELWRLMVKAFKLTHSFCFKGWSLLPKPIWKVLSLMSYALSQRPFLKPLNCSMRLKSQHWRTPFGHQQIKRQLPCLTKLSLFWMVEPYFTGFHGSVALPLKALWTHTLILWQKIIEKQL